MSLRPPHLHTAILTIGLLGALPSLAVVMGVTTAQVGVRDTANGVVVDTLKPGTVVGVLRIDGAWVQIMYLPTSGGGTKTGWIRSNEMRITSRSGTGGSGSCEREHKSGAEVCLTVKDAELDCRKSFAGEYYSECEVTVNYDLQTDYRGGTYLDVQVECEVEIQYTGRAMYSRRSDSASEERSHSLYAHGSESESLTFDFSFSSFNEVSRVKIESVVCKIESVNLW